jgi:hypothetical protein
MSDFWDATTIIAGKALKWGAYGAIAFGALSMPVVGLASIFSYGMPTLGTALMYGAGVGGAFGAVKGVADLPDDLRELKDEREYKQANNQVARDKALLTRSQLLAQNSQAQEKPNNVATNVSPNVNFGLGAGRAQGVGAAG